MNSQKKLRNPEIRDHVVGKARAEHRRELF